MKRFLVVAILSVVALCCLNAVSYGQRYYGGCYSGYSGCYSGSRYSGYGNCYSGYGSCYGGCSTGCRSYSYGGCGTRIARRSVGSCYSGNCYSGNCYSGNCYSGGSCYGNCYSGRCSTGTCYSGTCSTGTCTTGTCATGTCSTGTCSTGSCGVTCVPTGNPGEYLPTSTETKEETTEETKEEVKEESASTGFALTASEQRLVDLTNQHRRSMGLNQLVLDPKLCQAARYHSSNVCRTGCFSHYVGGTPFSRASMFGTTCSAENLAGVGDGTSAFWMFYNSPDHHANMVGQHTRIGVGIVGNTTTQMFGR